VDIADTMGGAGTAEPPRQAKLVDVAKLAGVSKATASKALNDRNEVRPETRRRVIDAAERLSFNPSSVARNLSTGRTSTVGVLTNDLEGRFVIPMLAGAEDALGAGQISVILCDARGDSIREKQHLRTLLERRIDGLIVMGGPHTDERLSLGRDLPLPVVYAFAPSSDPDDLSLTPDNVLAGRLAAEHLLSTGRQNIAFIGGDSSFIASLEREQGAREALAEHGMTLVGTGILHGDWTEKWGRAATARLLEECPDVNGIIGASDGIARAALDILRDTGRSVPRDVGVIGFDNWDIIVTNTRPELTSIDMDLSSLGRLAASRLFSALSGEPLGSGVQRLPVRLVVRNSTILDP
jgi:LacI family transcriptional regulator